jgi:hypothetical protein
MPARKRRSRELQARKPEERARMAASSSAASPTRPAMSCRSSAGTPWPAARAGRPKAGARGAARSVLLSRRLADRLSACRSALAALRPPVAISRTSTRPIPRPADPCPTPTALLSQGRRPRAQLRVSSFTADRNERQNASKQVDQRNRGEVRTALSVEPRDGRLCVFMPPVERIEDYLDLIAAAEKARPRQLGLPVHIEGYAPPQDRAPQRRARRARSGRHRGQYPPRRQLAGMRATSPPRSTRKHARPGSAPTSS